MDLHSTPVAAAAFLLLIGAGAVWDFGTRRIPNGLVVVTAVSGIVWGGIAHDALSVLLALACGVGVVVLLWIPWARGGIGGGDVKLAAAAAIWIGHEFVVAFLLVGAVVGGLVAGLAYIGSKREARAEMGHNLLLALILRAWPSPPIKKEGRISVPYAFAVFGGSAYVLAAPNLGWPV